MNNYWECDFWTAAEIARRKKRESVFRQAQELLCRHKPEGGKVLDVGCGIGTFLNLCRAQGWTITGVDPSLVACATARREYGIEVVNQRFSADLFPGKTFDAVFLAQVVHHVDDPVSLLLEVDRVLAKHGVLLIRTPNLIPQEPILRLQALLRKANGFFCGPSTYVFHPQTLKLVLERIGDYDVQFVNARPFLEAPEGPGTSATPVEVLKRTLVMTFKMATFGMAELIYRFSRGDVVVGPSIFVVAKKR